MVLHQTAYDSPGVRWNRDDLTPSRQASWSHDLPFPARAVLRRWRSLLGMVLGVGLALGLAMTLMATSRASVDFLAGDYRRSSADLYVHAEGGTLLPILPGESPGKIQHARNVLTQIRGLPGVQTAVGTITWPVERERADRKRRPNEPTELVSVVGVDGEPTAIPGTVVMRAGRWLRRSDELVVGRRLAHEKQLALGDTLRLAERDFRIVGVGRMRGVGYGSDGYAYMEYRALRQRADLGDVVNLVVVDTTRPELARERIPELDTLAVDSPSDLVRQAEKLMETSVVMQAILIGMTLAIAGLFVANVLGRSVTARRVELATLRAIGVPSRTILLVIAGEALFVILLATVIGVAFSLSMGWLIDAYLAPFYGIESLYVADAQLFLTVLALALTLGLLAGLVPARRATRVDPVEVLREA
jgi:ABC-type lipoprotein release transport system permease subunit